MQRACPKNFGSAKQTHMLMLEVAHAATVRKTDTLTASIVGLLNLRSQELQNFLPARHRVGVAEVDQLAGVARFEEEVARERCASRFGRAEPLQERADGGGKIADVLRGDGI